MFLFYNSYASNDKLSEPTKYSNINQGKEGRIKLRKNRQQQKNEDGRKN